MFHSKHLRFTHPCQRKQQLYLRSCQGYWRDASIAMGNFYVTETLLTLSQSSFRSLHRMCNRLQDTLIVRSSEGSSCTPAHLLEHVTTAVVNTKFWRRSSYDLSIPITRRFVIGSPWRWLGTPFPFGVEAWKVAAFDAPDGLVELYLNVRQSTYSSIEHRPPLVSLTY